MRHLAAAAARRAVQYESRKNTTCFCTPLEAAIKKRFYHFFNWTFVLSQKQLCRSSHGGLLLFSMRRKKVSKKGRFRTAGAPATTGAGAACAARFGSRGLKTMLNSLRAGQRIVLPPAGGRSPHDIG
ncbi:MAG: hypothetical protein P4L75_01410 [Clostridia bacterium]|nr:hypothetical protein [Clostridia bacterium]